MLFRGKETQGVVTPVIDQVLSPVAGDEEFILVELEHGQEFNGRHAEFFQGFYLGLGQSARFAFERPLLGIVPVDIAAEAVDQRGQLLRTKERGRAAAEEDGGQPKALGLEPAAGIVDY